MNIFHPSWRSDTFFDLWSFIHILWGVAGGTTLFLLSVSFATSFIIAVAVAIVWEIFEAWAGYGEDPLNIFSDILVGAAGFVIGYMFVGKLPAAIYILGGIILFLIALNWRGWEETFKLSKLKKKK